MGDNTAVSIENVSKSYRIVHNVVQHSTLAEQFVHKLTHPRAARPESETFWAVRDISFEVGRGEVVGIIGRNGAGKSTLLKLLSRITEPTSGQISLYGRLGSLLEVGTGFHPELTGKENIYLNGAILGMRRREIDAQLEAIVEFAGVSQFLDTPVKRYSSGMYVRLAFAVAAHLNPEILVIDEVLAVGDMEFQKKCLGKMKDVASGGRTVLFVSHQMQAIQALCQKAVFLKAGRLDFYGDVPTAIRKYMASGQNSVITANDMRRPGTGEVRFSKFDLNKRTYNSLDDITLDIEVAALTEHAPNYFISIEVHNAMGAPVLHLDSRLLNQEYEAIPRRRLRYTVRQTRLAQGDYRVHAYLCAAGVMDKFEDAAELTVEPILPYPAWRSDCVSSAAYYPEFDITDLPLEAEAGDELIDTIAS